MFDAWVGFVATIVGVVVGSGLGFLTQNSLWKAQLSIRWDSVRREAYAGFLGECNVYYQALCRVAHALRQNDLGGANRRFHDAEHVKVGVLSAQGAVDIIAGEATREVAGQLWNHLDQFNTALYNAKKSLEKTQKASPPGRADSSDIAYEPVRNAFIKAASLEIRTKLVSQDSEGRRSKRDIFKRAV